ncbi:MAG: rod shape-determining protein MreC [Clostridiales bacterium]|nr:rod shape-determining protein MreC [Clostridiales bacterium]
MKKKQQTPKKNTARKKLKDQAGNERYQALTRIASIGFILALLAVIVVLIAAVFFPDVQQLSKPREMIAQVITPIQKTFSTATDGIVGYLRTLKLRSNLEHEYEQLRIRAAELEDKAMLAESYRHQLETYADLDDEISRNINLQGIRANVIRREPSNYSYTFTIDVGTNQGVADNMAVVFSGALVGYTYDTLKDTTKVRGIVDGSARVPTLIESNRDQGWIEGTMAIDGSYACRMYYLDYTTLPRPGDRVVTSGVGIEFPKGIPVGFVRESTRQLEDSKQYIVIEPIADFDHLEYVVVYRYRPAYPEEAADRRTQAQTSFVPLPSINPVPTFIGQPIPEITAGPDGLLPGVDTIIQSTPEPTQTIQSTRDPKATVPPPNFEYNQKIITVEVSDTLSPLDTPTPSPKPTATFSVQQVTVEEDN